MIRCSILAILIVVAGPIAVSASALVQTPVSLALAAGAAASGDTERAITMLVNIYKKSTSEQDRLAAAITLTSFGPGSLIFADRPLYAHFVLHHPLSRDLLTAESRARLLRAEGLGWFSMGKWAEAESAFRELIATGTPPERALAYYQIGWIALNQARPLDALRGWLGYLNLAESQAIVEWRLPIIRDLAQAWCESGGGSPEISKQVAAMTLSEQESSNFDQGLRAGLGAISSAPGQWLALRNASGVTRLVKRVQELLLSNPSLLASRPCEILEWTDSSGIPGDSNSLLQAALSQCAISNHDLPRSKNEQLFGLLQSNRSRVLPSLIIADLGESLGRSEESCSEYYALALTQPTPPLVAASVRNCIKASPVMLAKIRSTLPAERPEFVPLTDWVLSTLTTQRDRLALLTKSVAATPDLAATVSGPEPILWWLEILQRLPVGTALSGAAKSWLDSLVGSGNSLNRLLLPLEVTTRIKLELALQYGVREAIAAQSAAIERVAAHSQVVMKLYRQWLNAVVSESLGSKIIAPLLLSSSRASPLLFSHSIGVQAVLGLSDGVLAEKEGEERFIRAAATFAKARAAFKASKKVVLNLDSPGFPEYFRNKANRLKRGSALLHRAAQEYAALYDLANDALHAEIEDFQKSILEISSPARWSPLEKSEWNRKKFELAHNIENWKKL